MLLLARKQVHLDLIQVYLKGRQSILVIRLVVTVLFPRYPFQKNKTIQKYLTIYGSTFPL